MLNSKEFPQTVKKERKSSKVASFQYARIVSLPKGLDNIGEHLVGSVVRVKRVDDNTYSLEMQAVKQGIPNPAKQALQYVPATCLKILMGQELMDYLSKRHGF